mgnify:CR=1 FL=1
MLTARYYLAWEKPNGEEIYCANAKTGYRPLQWCVYKGRFITPAFKFQSNRLPPAIRAASDQIPLGFKTGVEDMRFVNRLNLKILQSDFATRKMPMILRSFMKIQSTKLATLLRDDKVGAIAKTTSRLASWRC